MKFCIVSAHFGGKKPWTNQIKSKHDCKFVYYDDNNMPGRENAMHPRLKSKIPKMLASRYHKADWYIWMDSSVIIKPGVDLAQCVLDTANGNPLCLFKHTKLNRIQDEVKLVKQAVKSNVEYFEKRFKGEPILSQVNHYLSDKEFTDNKLFQMTFFAYHYSARELMQEWFMQNCLWSIKDQISFPYVLQKSGLKYSLFKGDALQNDMFFWNIQKRDQVNQI